MKTGVSAALLAGLMVVGLSACGEKPQTMGGVKQDSAPYTGVGTAYSDAQWKQRDRASWESHLRARAQRGQNDYERMN